jgi:hypothetical protein
MAVNVKKGTGAGLNYLFYGPVDGSGLLIGGTATPAVAGDTNGNPMLQLEYAKDFPVNPVEGQTENVTGDNTIANKYLFPPGDYPESMMVAGQYDADFHALVESTKVKDTAGISYVGIQPKNPNYRQMCYIVQSDGFSKDDGSTDEAMWQVMYVLKAQTQSLARSSFTEVAAGDIQYKLVWNQASNMPWGETFTETDNGYTQTVATIFYSQYPWHQAAFTGDNTQTDFVLPYTPVDSADWMTVWVDSVEKTYTTDYTIDDATKTVSFVAAPTTDANIQIAYGFVV